MSRLAIVVIVLLLAITGYAWYQKSLVASGFEDRESELLEAQRQLQDSIALLEAEHDSLRAEMETMEARLAQTRLSVEKLTRKPGLEGTLRRTYPELARTDWGVIEVYDERERGYVEYMAVPLWMSETFILDHQNAGRCLGSR